MTRDDARNEVAAMLTRPMFYILLALAEREAHGYGIMKEVSDHTDKAVRLAPGTLYRSIKQLLSTGYIEVSGERPDQTLNDERRRYYRITARGRAAMESEAVRLEQLVRFAQAKHVLLPGTPLLTEGIE